MIDLFSKKENRSQTVLFFCFAAGGFLKKEEPKENFLKKVFLDLSKTLIGEKLRFS